MRLPDDELAALKQVSLLRKLPENDPSLVNFSSNDYLGLAQSQVLNNNIILVNCSTNVHSNKIRYSLNSNPENIKYPLK